jgi:hypothetical protein
MSTSDTCRLVKLWTAQQVEGEETAGAEGLKIFEDIDVRLGVVCLLRQGLARYGNES